MPQRCAEALEPRTLFAAATQFAVIGDYGFAGEPARDVAALVQGWRPDLVITVGDNNYDAGAAETIDANIGQYYHLFIDNYRGQYGRGSRPNRFFPSLGNHDWSTRGAGPYLEYFTLPGNERYYEFVAGPVHFFALDSDPNEPDGTDPDSVQGRWLHEALTASTSPWNVVYFHHPPFSSGQHGSSPHMRWPFRDWGADAVFAGHDHTYERVIAPQDGLPYFVNGLGGRSIYGFGEPVAGSEVRFNEDYGAMRVEADERVMTFQFITRTGEVVDTYSLNATAELGATVVSQPHPPALRPVGEERRSGKVRVRVTNQGDALFAGPVTVSVSASPDQTADAADPVIATRTLPRLRLQPGRSKAVTVRFNWPAAETVPLVLFATAAPVAQDVL